MKCFDIKIYSHTNVSSQTCHKGLLEKFFMTNTVMFNQKSGRSDDVTKYMRNIKTAPV